MKTKLSLAFACLLLIAACVFTLSSCNGECKHKNAGDLIEEIAATCTGDGVKAHYVCADCGNNLDENKQVIEDLAIEKTGHKENPITKVESDPTCTETGSVAHVCIVCNETMYTKTTPALGHDYSSESLAIGPNDNICINGALIIKTCKTCGHVATDKLVANEDEGADGYHTVTEWTLLASPTLTDSGLMEGKCTNKHCQVTVTYELPPISSEYYTMTTAVPKIPCSGEYKANFAFNGESYFTYVITDGEDVQTVNKLSFEVTLPAHNHVLNGNEMGAESYDRDTDGIVYCPLCPECTLQGTQGYFVCDVCGELIYIHVEDRHTISEENWTITINPGCETEGEKQAVCEVGGCNKTVVEVIPALGHDYSYVLSLSEDGECYVLTGACKAKGCESTVVYYDVSGVTVEEFKPTCKCPGETVYKIIFTECSTDYSTSDLSAEFSVSVDQLDHTVNGAKITEGGLYNVVEYNFLEKYASSLVTCSATVDATVSCSVCERTDIVIDLYKNHTPLTDPQAGCVDSTETLTCKFCKTEYEVELIGTGHSIESYTEIKKADEDNMYYIAGFCSKCCNEGEVVFDADAVELTVVENKGTCKTAGSIRYSLNGTLIAEVNTGLSAHVLSGVEMPNPYDTPYIASNYPGIQPFGDATINSCSVPADAYFICDECKEVVKVQAVKDHSVASWTIESKATCEVEGVEAGYCTDCGAKAERVIPATGHTYEYDFTLSTKTLVGTCTKDGCEHSYSLTRVKRVITDSTCVNNGSVSYTGLNADGNEKTVVLTLPLVAHTIEGINVNADGAYEITEGRVGALANVEAICEKSVNGYYICDCCGSRILSLVYQPHISESEEDAEVVAPNCTTDGSKTFCCSLCDEVVTVINLPALGHDYSIEISTLPTEDSVGIAIGSCHCGENTFFELPVISSDNYDAPKVIKETSCLEDGIYLYSYTITDNDKTYAVEFEIITSKFVYNESCATCSLEIEEEVSFIDPFGDELTEKVTVTYVYFECPGVDCEINILLSKSFVYDENLFVYDFDLGAYFISLPEGEK